MIAVNGFLSAGINPNTKDQDGDTALTSAAARGDSKIVNALLQGNADVNAKGRNGWTALLLALEDERNDVAEELLAQPNVDLKAETPNGMTALMLAVWHQRDAVVRKLLDRGVDVNHQDKDGEPRQKQNRRQVVAESERVRGEKERKTPHRRPLRPGQHEKNGQAHEHGVERVNFSDDRLKLCECSWTKARIREPGTLMA